MSVNHNGSKIGEISGTLFTLWLSSVFTFLFPILYNVKITGMRNFHVLPSTLITINHRRDLDIPIIGGNLLFRKTVFKNKRRLHFVARDDLFEPGFISTHFKSLWLGKAFEKLNIRPVMHGLRAHPMSFLTKKRFCVLVRDIIRLHGDAKLEEILKQEFIDELSHTCNHNGHANLGALKLSEFLRHEYREYHEIFVDTGVLNNGMAREVRMQSLAIIEKQLHECAEVLNHGSILFIAPEGDLSPDGRFSRVKSGLYRMFSMTKGDVRVLPISSTYDFMTRKRMRIYVDIGEERIVSHELSKAEMEKLVQKNIVNLGRVTMGQIGSEFLLKKVKAGDNFTSETELASALISRAKYLKKGGLFLDERMNHDKSFNSRLQDFTDYCLEKQILERNTHDGFIIHSETVLHNHGTDFRSNPVQYSYNELCSMLEQASVQ